MIGAWALPLSLGNGYRVAAALSKEVTILDQERFTELFAWVHGESLAILMNYEFSNTDPNGNGAQLN